MVIMAEKPRTAGSADEPSIEEILGSIRRIIAEDEEVPAAAASPETVEEPLELTNKIEQDGTIVQPEPAPVSAPTPAPEPAPAATANVAFEEEVKPMPTSEDNTTTEELISATTADATAAVMAKLARRTAIADEGDEGPSIESLIRQLLRPMLRDWLDTHLPEIVEKVVARELERLSKRI